MKRIVVGLDNSEAASTALRWSGHIARAERAELVVLNAFEPPYAEVSHDETVRLVAERQALLDGPWTESILAEATLRRIVRQGDPRKVLLELGNNQHADLVVLGRTGHGGGPGLLHLGSVVEYCAHHCTQPLAVIPASAADRMHRIVVGVDGSDESLNAATWSARLAQSVGASIVAVAVRDMCSGSPHRSTATSSGGIEKRIASWASPLAAIGMTVEIVGAANTHPVDGLLSAVDDHEADLLVVGARGAGGIAGLRVGGTALKALHHTTVPFVMVPTST